MKRIEIAVLIGIVAAVFLSSLTAFAGQCDEVREQVVRLHILANSDSDADQELKLAVRDAVLLGTEELFTTSSGKEEIEALAADTLPRIEAIARAEITRQGYDYDVQVSFVNMYFNTRVYGETTFPAGHYDAVRIEIGAAEGQNWWCVMFPPLCIPAVTDDESAQLEEQIAQLGETPQYEAKFALVELVEEVRDWWNS